MPLFWFIAGVLTTLALLVVLSPWLRTLPAFASLPAAPWQGSVVAVVIVAALFASYGWLVRPDVAGRPSSPPATPPATAAGKMQLKKTMFRKEIIGDLAVYSFAFLSSLKIIGFVRPVLAN